MMNYFDSDHTTRWSAREGDFIIWARCRNPFSGEAFEVVDLWQLRDGNYVTITNREADLPDYFDLHPSEAAGEIAHAMLSRLNSGGHAPAEPVVGLNLWRIFAGDRIAWVGRRTGNEGSGNVIESIEFKSNALAYGEPFGVSDGTPAFGGFDMGMPSAEDGMLCQEGFLALNRGGGPRTMAATSRWTIGG